MENVSLRRGHLLQMDALRLGTKRRAVGVGTCSQECDVKHLHAPSLGSEAASAMADA